MSWLEAWLAVLLVALDAAVTPLELARQAHPHRL
jgi:hypothetical protein